jgi:hypothetical protein
MKIQNKVLTAIAEARKAGYEQVSASEVAHKTGLTSRAVIARLHKAGIKTVIRRGEIYVSLLEMQPIARPIYFGDLPKPRSAILNEVD